jgi:hypothetical protein
MEESVFDVSEKLTVSEPGKQGGVLNGEQAAICFA